MLLILASIFFIMNINSTIAVFIDLHMSETPSKRQGCCVCGPVQDNFGNNDNNLFDQHFAPTMHIMCENCMHQNMRSFPNMQCYDCGRMINYMNILEYIKSSVNSIPKSANLATTTEKLTVYIFLELLKVVRPKTIIYTLGYETIDELEYFEEYFEARIANKSALFDNFKNEIENIVKLHKKSEDGQGPAETDGILDIKEDPSYKLYSNSLFFKSLRPELINEDLKHHFSILKRISDKRITTRIKDCYIDYINAKILAVLGYTNISDEDMVSYLLPYLLKLKIYKNNLIEKYISEYRVKHTSRYLKTELVLLNIFKSTVLPSNDNYRNIVEEYFENENSLKISTFFDFIFRAADMVENDDLFDKKKSGEIFRAFVSMLVARIGAVEISYADIVYINNIANEFSLIETDLKVYIGIRFFKQNTGEPSNAIIEEINRIDREENYNDMENLIKMLNKFVSSNNRLRFFKALDNTFKSQDMRIFSFFKFFENEAAVMSLKKETVDSLKDHIRTRPYIFAASLYAMYNVVVLQNYDFNKNGMEIVRKLKTVFLNHYNVNSLSLKYKISLDEKYLVCAYAFAHVYNNHVNSKFNGSRLYQFELSPLNTDILNIMYMQLIKELADSNVAMYTKALHFTIAALHSKMIEHRVYTVMFTMRAENIVRKLIYADIHPNSIFSKYLIPNRHMSLYMMRTYFEYQYSLRRQHRTRVNGANRSNYRNMCDLIAGISRKHKDIMFADIEMSYAELGNILEDIIVTLLEYDDANSVSCDTFQRLSPLIEWVVNKGKAYEDTYNIDVLYQPTITLLNLLNSNIEQHNTVKRLRI